MDAKPPQRAFRALSTINDENINPAVFAKNHQRQKSTTASVFKDAGIAAVKIPAKRTAFGDVSNVVRPLAYNGVPGFKAGVEQADASKAGFVSTAPMPTPPPAAHAKEASGLVAPTAGFLAPAQRPRNSLAPASSVSILRSDLQAPLRQPEEQPIGASDRGAPHLAERPQAGAARKTAVVFSNDVKLGFAPAVLRPDPSIAVNDVVDTAATSWSQPKRSPRHSKSQPCLKNADGFEPQQKRPLRRTLSRLPTDYNAFKEVAVFPDAGRKSANQPAMVSDNGVVLDGEYNSYGSQSQHYLHGVLSTGSAGYANEASFVDAVGDFQTAMPPPLSNDCENDIGRLRDEIESAAIVADEPPKPMEDQIRYLPSSETVVDDFLADVPGATVASALSEIEEPWDDDADFYDDQAYTTAHSFRSLGDNTTGALTTVVMPKMTAKIQNELDIAKAIVEASISPDDLDDEAWDVSMVAEYGDEIHVYMRELEAKMLPSPYYMDMQTEIQWSMRSVLMEWLIQVHSRFNLLPETLFLAVNYIDRFLSSKIVSVAKLQLVGATAIFIAAKYEEIICPSIQEIVYMVDGGYTTDEILKAERFMLSMLGFELGWPGPMSFLRRISRADDYDLDTRTLAKYFLEVTIMDERFVACPASFLAAGAHCLARLMLCKGDWTTAHTHYSGYTWSQVRPLATTILHCCRNPRTHHAAVYEKYVSSKFKKASVFVEEEVRRGFMVPSSQTYHRRRPSCTDSFAGCSDESSAALRSTRTGMLIHTES